MALWRWLGLSGAGAETGDDGLGAVERALDGMTPAHARFIACFAYILTRAARADHHISEDELRAMEGLVERRAGLSAEDARLVVAIAKAHAHRAGGTEDFLVTREFNAVASRDQKMALLDCLFAVTSSDSEIVTAEDNEIRRIANELKLEHADYITARRAHLQHLAVLRREPPR